MQALSQPRPLLHPARASRPRRCVTVASQRENLKGNRSSHSQPQAVPDRSAAAERGQGPHGGAGVDRREAAQREILEMRSQPQAPQQQQQRRDMTASDDEWEHTPKTTKWWMELKAVLYSWLGTGVEPL